jgi:hypothetical protein
MAKTPLNRFTMPLAGVIVNYRTARFLGPAGWMRESKAAERYTILIDGRWKMFEFTRKKI